MATPLEDPTEPGEPPVETARERRPELPASTESIAEDELIRIAIEKARRLVSIELDLAEMRLHLAEKNLEITEAQLALAEQQIDQLKAENERLREEIQGLRDRSLQP